MVLLEQVDLQKRFQQYPSSSIYGAANRNAANQSSGTRNSRRLAGNAGNSRAVRCFRIREFFFFIQGIHLVLWFLKWGQKLIPGTRILFLLQTKFINSQLSDSIRLLTANSS